MVYYLDTNSFRLLEAYYPGRFPTFWKNFDEAAKRGQAASIREVWKEIQNGSPAPHILDWAKRNKAFFKVPDEHVLGELAGILAVKQHHQMIGKKQLLRGTPVADPFLIAAAMVAEGCVVTEERDKPNSVKIPTVCKYYDIRCINLEEMMTELNWSF